MASEQRTTGQYKVKLYKCRQCGHEMLIGTNHWGKCYPQCPVCSWKRPGQVSIFDCLESPPPGYGKPTPWTIVQLGDILKSEP